MRNGTGITLPEELPLDPTFLTNIDRLQSVFLRWFPGLRAAPIRATIGPRTVRTLDRATGYSGGIDSSFTIDALGERLDTAMLIDGIEYREDSPVLFDRISDTLEAAVARRNLRMVRVRTNVKAFGRAFGAKWSEALGGAIASSVHAAGFAEYHVAASNSWENLRPYGSHPLTDPLWSSATVRIEHHGAERRRIDKIRIFKAEICICSIDSCSGKTIRKLLVKAGEGFKITFFKANFNFEFGSCLNFRRDQHIYFYFLCRGQRKYEQEYNCEYKNFDHKKYLSLMISIYFGKKLKYDIIL
jgi:hypothetical protein